MRVKRRRARKRGIIFLLILLFLFLFFLIHVLFHKVIDINVLDITQSSDEIIIQLDKDAKCSIDNIKYIDSKNKICKFNFVEKLDILYTKDENGNVKKHRFTKFFFLLEKFDVTDEKIYLAKGGSYKINYVLKYKGYTDKKVTFLSDNNGVASVSQDGLIKGVNDGKTTITVDFNGDKKKIKVIVTNLISSLTEDFNYDKPYLSCGLFTEDDNDLLDEILEDRVKNAGYKTRAGAVAAARFLTLEFPYRINYFSENGRLYSVDGEGRYYHKGLYLHESRFSVIDSKLVKHGPNPWGCDIHSDPAGGLRKNGLDCSGFITWVLYQGGFDPGDISAGVNAYAKDLTDLGTKEKVSDSLDKIKIGDLLSGDGETTNASQGGHIAMLIGKKNGYYYVAEELWGKPSLSHGAVAQKYTEEEFKYYFYWRIDMKEFYGKDGNLTDYWL